MRQGVDVGGARALFTTAGEGAVPYRHNFALNVGEPAEAVAARRRALARDIGRPIVWMRQTHSTTVDVLGERHFHPGAAELEIDADAVVIDARAGAGRAPAAAVLVADCVPVLLATGDGAVVAAIHAGRRGINGRIVTAAVRRMEALGVETRRLSAAIGPAICGQCYEVGAELHREAGRATPAALSTTSWGTPALDLPAAVERELEGLGVGAVERDPRCTREDPSLNSYRRDGVCGRQIGLVIPA